MPPTQTVKDRACGRDEPDWAPLLKLAPEHVDDFMWMFAVELDDGRRLQACKHYWTRRYLHLDHSECAFVYEDDTRYRQVDAAWLLELVLGRPFGRKLDAEEIP